jgi:hypothetical protein
MTGIYERDVEKSHVVMVLTKYPLGLNYPHQYASGQV